MRNETGAIDAIAPPAIGEIAMQHSVVDDQEEQPVLRAAQEE
jgi:hypothetical protein